MADEQAQTQKLTMITSMQQRIEMFKNPVEIDIHTNLNPEIRERMYNLIHATDRNAMITSLASCGDVNAENYDFMNMPNERRKKEIEKLEERIKRLTARAQ